MQHVQDTYRRGALLNIRLFTAKYIRSENMRLVANYFSIA